MRPPLVPSCWEPRAEAAPWALPPNWAEQRLKSLCSWVGSERFRDAAKGTGRCRGFPPPPSFPIFKCCESGSSRQGPGELLFPDRLLRAARSSYAVLEGHQGAGGAEGENNPLRGYRFDFYRTAQLPGCSCKNRSKAVEANLSLEQRGFLSSLM